MSNSDFQRYSTDYSEHALCVFNDVILVRLLVEKKVGRMAVELDLKMNPERSGAKPSKTCVLTVY